MRRISIQRIEGLPPKKDGARSMWNKGVEVPRLIALRRATLNAMKGDAPLSRDISVGLILHLRDAEIETVGDLDNFVTGICDGLQAAAPRTPNGALWSDEELAEIHPRRIIGITNDAAVLVINARKMPSDDQNWYSLELTGL